MVAPATFRSLRIRNYRIFFIGEVISVAGTWTQTVALAVLVLKLSNKNGLAAGAVIALQTFPTMVLGLWAGVLADRKDRRTILMTTQSCLAATTAVLAVLDIAGVIELWMVFVLVALTGVANALDVPARQSFVPELVGPDDLANAIGLTSTIFNSARIVGPAIAGVVILVAGTGACFAVNAASYLATLYALFHLDTTQLHRGERVPRAPGQVRAGVRYAWSEPLLRSNLLLMTFVATLAFNFAVVLPLLATVTFDGGDGAVAAIFGFQGVGALMGALTVATIRRTDGRRLVLAAVALGITMCIASGAPTLVLMCGLMILVGLAQNFTASSSNAMIQLDSIPSMRGRVSSLRALVVMGSTPIGGLLAGGIAQTAGPRWAMAMGGVGCLAGAAAFGRHLFADSNPQVAPIVEDVLET